MVYFPGEAALNLNNSETYLNKMLKNHFTQVTKSY